MSLRVIRGPAPGREQWAGHPRKSMKTEPRSREARSKTRLIPLASLSRNFWLDSGGDILAGADDLNVTLAISQNTPCVSGAAREARSCHWKQYGGAFG